MLLAALAVLFVVVTDARPAYDAMGFLVWGREALHGSLNTNAAPSWKPLPFLATLPDALVGRQGQMWLWTVTAAAGGIAAVGLGGRLAYRLTPPVDGRRWARVVAALIAAGGIASMVGWFRLLVIANSDPLTVALVLGAIDLHLSRRFGAAVVVTWLAALGRPEMWPILLAYGLSTYRRLPEKRWLVVGAVVSAPALWFVIPGITSDSWFSAGNLALGQSTVIHGNKLVGVLERFRTLTGVPLQVAAIVSLAIVLVRRHARAGALVAGAALWVVVEIAFALHGWSAVQRYLVEPAAVMMVVTGVGVGLALSSGERLWRWLAPLATVVLVIALVPFTRDTLRTDHGLSTQAHTEAQVLSRLTALVSADGGPNAIRACGAPIGPLKYESTLAWELETNVRHIGFSPRRAAVHHRPVVLFSQQGRGWRIQALRAPPAKATQCASLDRRS